jgi:hypothetical protein
VSIKALKLKGRISFAFGNLAILIPKRDGGPMALRPRLSTGLPLSDEYDDKVRTKRAWSISRLAKDVRWFYLQQPGDPDPKTGWWTHGFASPPFDRFAISDVVWQHYSNRKEDSTFHFSNTSLQD